MADPERPGAQEWVPARIPANDAGIRELEHAAQDCRGCELWAKATQLVFSSGDATAPLMLVGEQPGDREDREGVPFVGPAGLLLEEALASAGIDRGSVYLTNAVKHFRFSEAPRGKRRIHATPEVGHITACHPWLQSEMAIVHPEVVVCLGATAGRSVLGRPVRIGAERGAVLADRVGDSLVLITAHPSAVLRLRGKDGFDAAFDQLVADLASAKSALH
jgi:uracil-DNA glycosylase